MQIDGSNYEIWIIDWLDGKLNDHQVGQLKLFLRNNPDLSDELDNLENISLKQPGSTFRDKRSLIKSAADLNESQFEYLCVGYLENELSEDQKTELFETINHSPEKKRTFDLIQKSRLSPANLKYPRKKLLIKRTAAQKVIRMTVIGLSAAATIAILILTYLFIPHNLSEKNSMAIQNSRPDTTRLQRTDKKVPAKELIIKETMPLIKQRNNHLALVKKTVEESPETNTVVPERTDSTVEVYDRISIPVAAVPSSENIVVQEEIELNGLVALNLPHNAPLYDDGRSKLGRFLAKTIREKILKEKVIKDTPLKGYEIAEAGVTGLNKLLGWEMALDEKKDASGELSSVYFSSKILKFNAPVKKTELLQ